MVNRENVATEGFEPPHQEPKSCALPLRYVALLTNPTVLMVAFQAEKS